MADTGYIVVNDEDDPNAEENFIGANISPDDEHEPAINVTNTNANANTDFQLTEDEKNKILKKMSDPKINDLILLFEHFFSNQIVWYLKNNPEIKYENIINEINDNDIKLIHDILFPYAYFEGKRVNLFSPEARNEIIKNDLLPDPNKSTNIKYVVNVLLYIILEIIKKSKEANGGKFVGTPILTNYIKNPNADAEQIVAAGPNRSNYGPGLGPQPFGSEDLEIRIPKKGQAYYSGFLPRNYKDASVDFNGINNLMHFREKKTCYHKAKYNKENIIKLEHHNDSSIETIENLTKILNGGPKKKYMIKIYRIAKPLPGTEPNNAEEYPGTCYFSYIEGEEEKKVGGSSKRRKTKQRKTKKRKTIKHIRRKTKKI